MPQSDLYRRQVALLIRLIPLVAEEDCFALKGGTAINLFVRDLPRLSVDIDLAYLPIADREASLQQVDAALKRIANRAQKVIGNVQIQAQPKAGSIWLTRLTIHGPASRVIVEVTPVLRGCVFPPEIRAVTNSVEEQFGFAQTRLVSFADLYAGKMVAALDRQHPRDLFDIRELLANEGINDDLRRAFLVYLVSHGRRMSEILCPTRKDLQAEFEHHFVGMTTNPIDLDELYAARESLIETLVAQMPQPHRQFLISLKATGKADWDGLGISDAQELPAVKWRLQNLEKIEPSKRREMVTRLAEVLGCDIPPTGGTP